MLYQGTYSTALMPPNMPINLFCDNKFIISLIKNGTHGSNSKHINLNFHYIQYIVEREKLKLNLFQR